MHRADGAPARRLLALRRRVDDQRTARPAADPIAAAVLNAEAEARVSAERWIDGGGTYFEPPARRVAASVGQR